MRPLRIYGGLLLAVLVPVLALESLVEGIAADSAEQRQRAAALQALLAVRAGIEGQVHLNMLLVHTVAGAIAAQPGMDQARYARLVRALADHSVGLRNIGAAPDLVVRLVYPLEGNESVIGLDYRRHPEQGPRAIRVAQTGEPAVIGPLPLRQGGLGIIIRHPLLKPDAAAGAAAYELGLVSAALDVDRLYRASGLTALLGHFRVAVRGTDGTGADGPVFFGEPSVLAADPVRQEVLLPGGSWDLAVVPKAGWGIRAPIQWGMRAAAGLVILVAVLAGWLILRANDRLRRVVASLGDSEARQRTLLASLPDLIWLKDPRGVYLACNARFEQFFGAPAAAIIGRRDSDFLTAEQAAFFRAKDQAAIDADGPTRYEEWVTFASDGHRELLDTIKTPVHGDDGALLGVLGIGRDITARHAAEVHLRRLKHLHALIAAANERIVRLRDPDRIYREVCRLAVEAGGLKMAWIGLLADDEERVRPVARAGGDDDYLDQLRILPRGDGPLGRGPTGSAIRDGRHQCCNDIATDERMLPWRDAALTQGFRAAAAFPLRVGERVRGAISLYADAAGFFDDAVLGLLDELASDLGLALELSEADAARRHTEAKLQVSEERFRALVEHSMTGIYVLQERRVVYVNPRFAELYGYDSPEALIGLDASALIAPDQRHRVFAQMRKRESGEEPRMHYESVACRRDGSLFPIEVYGSRIRLEDGPAIIGSMLDISERHQAELRVRELNADLERRVAQRTAALTEANRELETFAYSVSHDLKAPLRAIGGYSRLLLNDHAAQLNDEGRTFLGNVREGVARMDELIEDLLAYSRMDRQRLRRQVIDLPALIDELIATRRHDIDATAARITRAIAVDAVEADVDALALVLRNLLDNALKFHGEQPPAIEIGAQRRDGSTILSVRDQGIGFDMKFHDRIFDVFQRLQRGQAFPGTGVGLALVRRAVQRMGGRVWAESAPGQGARFFVELPA